HLDEHFAWSAVFVHANGDVTFVAADAEFVRDRSAFVRHLLALGTGEELALHRLADYRSRRFRFLFIFLGGAQWLGTLGVVTIDSYSLQPQLPRFAVRIADVFDRGFLRHVDGLGDRAGKERLRRSHHFHVPGPGNGPATGSGKRAIEHREMLGLQIRRAFHGAGFIDVRDDFAGLLGRVTELQQRLRDGVVDDFDDAAAHQLLVLHKGQIRLDAGGVAIHHEADSAGGREHGDLRILEAVLFAFADGGVPRFLSSQKELRLYVLGLDATHSLAVHAHDI